MFIRKIHRRIESKKKNRNFRFFYQAEEVSVYAKLPRSFQIPTPVGHYSPDWPIAFKKGMVKHIFFIAETKGSLDSMDLRGVENAKIACAKKLSNDLSTSHVKYWNVTTYQDLMDTLISLLVSFFFLMVL